MRLKNKKTGEVGTPIVGYQELYVDTENGYTYHYESLQDMCEEWEDYEEPKEYWYIYADKSRREEYGDFLEENFKAVGNYFETKEEAEKAVEKLKAWKRLKDSGFRFNGGDDACISYRIDPAKWNDKLDNDFDLLFGGEE